MESDRYAAPLGLTLICLWLLVACRQDSFSRPAPDQDLFSSQRERMVVEQLAGRDIVEPRVLSAMRRVPRHLFVPESSRKYAYTDQPLPIGEGQTISQPYIVAYMTQALKLERGDRVLEIGTGSGYQAAVLAELVDEVYTIEIIPTLAQQARKRLIELGYSKVQVRTGDGYLGWPEAAPFDAIVVTAAPDHIPPPLVEQLAEGGRLVLPLGEGYQELVRVVKEKGKIRQERLLPVRFVPMTGRAQQKE